MNAAREPEVVDVADSLIKMGARIEGVGTPTLWIRDARRCVALSIPCFPTASRRGPMPWPPP